MSADSRVEVEITPTIEREFKRRGVFLELRLENAIRIKNGATGIYLVARAQAQSLLADARFMRTQGKGRNGDGLPPGVRWAYSAIVSNVGFAIAGETPPTRAEVRRRRLAEHEAEMQRQQAATPTAPRGHTSTLPEAARQGSYFLACAIEKLGLEGVRGAVHSLRQIGVVAAKSAVRELPAGWRVIEGQRPGGAT